MPMSTQKDIHSDAIALIAGIGQKARTASRAMARASTASKNEALIHLAGLVKKMRRHLRLLMQRMLSEPRPMAKMLLLSIV